MIKYKNKITGEIAEESPRFKNFYLVQYGHSIHKRFIENSNDWQKVEEVDYEVLSFFNEDNKEVYYKTNGGSYEYSNTYRQLNYCLNYYKIHSVKRLSDGEVFTIGDNINYDHYSNFNKITKIYLTQQKGNIKEGIWMDYAGGSCHISIAKKIPAKTPLFTTEDGVDIYEGDKYTAVQKSTFDILKECRHKVNEAFIAFSTPEKAKEYILLNKPCLSLNDLLSVWGGQFPKDSPLFKTFKELAKSKL